MRRNNYSNSFKRRPQTVCCVPLRRASEELGVVSARTNTAKRLCVGFPASSPPHQHTVNAAKAALSDLWQPHLANTPFALWDGAFFFFFVI
jgi:hypothetical protein